MIGNYRFDQDTLCQKVNLLVSLTEMGTLLLKFLLLKKEGKHYLNLVKISIREDLSLTQFFIKGI